MATTSKYPEHYDDEEEDDDDDDEEEFDGDDEDDEPSQHLSAGSEEDRLEAVLRRLTADEVRIRVHDVAIRGCARTRRAAAEAAVGSDLARAATVPELLRAAAAAGERLRRLGAFESVAITLDAAPPGVPSDGRGGVVVVLVDVTEARGGAAGGLGIFAHTEVRTDSSENCLLL
jgi:outer membrane protein insertion porin family